MLRYALAAVAFFGATLALGVATREPSAPGIDAAAQRAFYGRGTALAWIFTSSGYAPALLGIYLALGVIAFAFHGSWIALAALAATQLLSQASAKRLKAFFKRLRPEKWLRRQELDASFPSGHAATAAVTFAGIVVVIFRSNLPEDAKLAAGALPAIFVAGIGWSRIALGAHHLSDVLGGYALGAAWLCALLAALALYGV